MSYAIFEGIMTKECPSNTNYVIYSDGRVWSKFKARYGDGFMCPFITKKGYSALKLQGNIHQSVHRLVAETFVPNPDNKEQVNHKDGNKLNNHYTNLEWMTRKENAQHAWKLGLCAEDSMRGSNNPGAILTEELVLHLRKIVIKYDPVYGVGALAEKYGVAETTLCQALSGVSWKHI